MDPPKKITILFGTQTGNSEDVALRIGRQITRMKCKNHVLDLADFSAARLVEESFVIIVCSTTGNGEFTDNMKTFWRFLLRKDLPNNSLCHLNFCVFGLGDSSYEKYNVVAKKLNKRLSQLGALEFLPLTLADDQHELGYDAALDPWLSKLKENLTEFYSLTDDSFLSDDVPLPPKFTVVFDTDNLTNNVSVDHSSQMISTLKSNRRVTSNDHFQAVHHLEFDIDTDVYYAPGDVAVVWPQNSTEDVEEFLTLLNVPPDEPFTLIPSDSEIIIPKLNPYPCTVRQCAMSYFDIKSIPRRSFFEFFYHFSQDETEKEKLFEFTTAPGQEELYDYCNRPRRNILEVLKDFPHTTPHVPFEYLFNMIPVIRPRSFSIASSLRAHPCQFHLLVAVVEYKTRMFKPRKGLCSNWITSLTPGSTIPFGLKNGSISLPKSPVPVILIGPGTGCAPFRSFIEDRSLDGIGENYLFFGNRYKDKDYLFSDTWEQMCKKSNLKIFTAFSRDQEDKIYVQHRIKENGPLLWDLVDHKKAVVYVAGNAKQMPQGVRDAFLEVFKKEGYLDEDGSARYLQVIENAKRYQVETWA